MRLNRWVTGWLTVAVLLGILWLPSPVAGQGSEAAGMITEIKIGRGRVEVRPVGTQDWRRAGPLLALRAGDAVRATEDASVVILLSGSRGGIKVAAADSPFVVSAAKPGETKAQKALTLLGQTVGYLSTTGKEEPRATLSTRAGTRPPVILGPRNGPVLPNSLAFEWLGSRLARYSIQIAGPKGVVLEKKDLTGAKFDYPPDSPPFTPGVRYTVQVLSGSHPAQQAWFEVLDGPRAQAIQQDMRELEQTLGPTVSANTLATLQAGLLASNGLLHDARLVLIGALAKDPEEPTLHYLLGNLYNKLGLPEQAAESYDESRFLVTSPGN